jgi:hypothetical protein
MTEILKRKQNLISKGQGFCTAFSPATVILREGPKPVGVRLVGDKQRRTSIRTSSISLVVREA